MPTYLPQIEPNRTGTLNTWDVPMGDWMGLKFGVGRDDTVGNAVSRWSEDFFDDSPEMKPDAANAAFGIPGQLSFTGPVRVQTAMRKKERKEREIRYAAYLDAASHESMSWKAAAGAARFGLERGILGTTKDLPGIFRKFPNLTAAVINGTLGNAVAEIPIGLQKWSDQADYGLGDAVANVAVGGVLGGGFHLTAKALGAMFQRVASKLTTLDKATQAAILNRELSDALHGRNSSGFEAVRFSESEIAKEINAANVFDEAAATAEAARLVDESGPVQRTPDLSPEAATSESGQPSPVRAGEAPPAKGNVAESKGIANTSGERPLTLTVGELGELEQLRLNQEAFGELNAKKTARLAELEAKETASVPVSSRPVTNEAVIAERSKRIAEYVERERERHNLEVKGKIKAAVDAKIAAQQKQGKVLPDVEVEKWSKAAPETSHIAALQKDAATIEQQILAAAGEEGKDAAVKNIEVIKKRAATEAETAAIDEAINCVGAGRGA